MGLQSDLAAAQQRVQEALLDNINTRGALDALLELVKSVNVYLAKKDSTPGEFLFCLVIKPSTVLWIGSSGAVVRSVNVNLA